MSRAPVYAYFHEGNAFHLKCLLHKFSGYPVTKGTRTFVMENQLSRFGPFPRELGTWEHPPCHWCSKHILPDHPPEDFVPDTPTTWRCNLCDQPAIPDIYQHERWHQGLSYLPSFLR